MGATLWHVLHEGSPDSFEEELARLSQILTRPWTSWWESMGLKKGGDPRVAAAVASGRGTAEVRAASLERWRSGQTPRGWCRRS